MSDRDADGWLSPSDEEKEAAQRTVLEATFSALEGLREDSEAEDFTRLLLMAFQVAHERSLEIDKEFHAKNGDKTHGHYIEVHHIVASAMHGTLFAGSDIHPYAIVTWPYVHFARVCAALEAANSCEMFLDFELGELYGADMARKISPWGRRKNP